MDPLRQIIYIYGSAHKRQCLDTVYGAHQHTQRRHRYQLYQYCFADLVTSKNGRRQQQQRQRCYHDDDDDDDNNKYAGKCPQLTFKPGIHCSSRIRYQL